VLDVYVMPALVGAMGVLALASSFAAKVPREEELVRVTGELQVYDFAFSGRRRVTILSLTDQPQRFWTDALPPESARALLRVPLETSGSAIELFVERQPRAEPIAGDAMASYGLRIDDRTIQALDERLEHERKLTQTTLPALGAALVLLAIFGHLWSKKRRPPGPWSWG